MQTFICLILRGDFFTLPEEPSAASTVAALPRLWLLTRVAVKELTSSYDIGETHVLHICIYTHYGNLI